MDIIQTEKTVDNLGISRGVRYDVFINSKCNLNNVKNDELKSF